MALDAVSGTQSDRLRCREMGRKLGQARGMLLARWEVMWARGQAHLWRQRQADEAVTSEFNVVPALLHLRSTRSARTHIMMNVQTSSRCLLQNGGPL
jgi:hypothetical protein